MRSPAFLKTENKVPAVAAPVFNSDAEALAKSVENDYGLNGVNYNFGKIKVHSDSKYPNDYIRIQPKLKINQPGDVYEREADAIAEKIVRMPNPTNPNINLKPTASTIQRKCADREKEENEEGRGIVMRKTSGGFGIEPPLGISDQIFNSKSRGIPLPDSTRNFMENAFGTDFRHVRIHTNSEAVHLNKAIGAEAFTYGTHIYFGEGNSIVDNELTAHELTHVVQQTGGAKKIGQTQNHVFQGENSSLGTISLTSEDVLQCRQTRHVGVLDNGILSRDVYVTIGSSSGTLPRGTYVEIIDRPSNEEIRVKVWSGYGGQETTIPATTFTHVNQRDDNDLDRVDMGALGRIPAELRLPLPSGARYSNRAERHEGVLDNGILTQDLRNIAIENSTVTLPAGTYIEVIHINADGSREVRVWSGFGGQQTTIPTADFTRAFMRQQRSDRDMDVDWDEYLRVPDNQQQSFLNNSRQRRRTFTPTSNTASSRSEQTRNEDDTTYLTPEEAREHCRRGNMPGVMIFPLSMPGPFNFRPAPLIARRDGDQIVVSYPVTSSVFSHPIYRRDVRTLPRDMIHNGVRLDPNSLVKVRVYSGSEDNEERRSEAVCVTGEQMLRISAAGDTAVGLGILQTIAMAGSILVPGGGTWISSGIRAGATSAINAGLGSLVVQEPLVQAGLQERVDWGEFGFRAIFGAVTGFALGAISHQIAARLASNPATLFVSRQRLPDFVRDLIIGTGLRIVESIAHDVFNQLRGQGITRGQFINHLIEQLMRPEALFMDLLLGSLGRARNLGAHSSAEPAQPQSPLTVRTQETGGITPSYTTRGAAPLTSPIPQQRAALRGGRPIRLPVNNNAQSRGASPGMRRLTPPRGPGQRSRLVAAALTALMNGPAVNRVGSGGARTVVEAPFRARRRTSAIPELPPSQEATQARASVTPPSAPETLPPIPTQRPLRGVRGEYRPEGQPATPPIGQLSLVRIQPVNPSDNSTQDTEPTQQQATDVQVQQAPMVQVVGGGWIPVHDAVGDQAVASTNSVSNNNSGSPIVTPAVSTAGTQSTPTTQPPAIAATTEPAVSQAPIRRITATPVSEASETSTTPSNSPEQDLRNARERLRQLQAERDAVQQSVQSNLQGQNSTEAVARAEQRVRAATARLEMASPRDRELRERELEQAENALEELEERFANQVADINRYDSLIREARLAVARAEIAVRGSQVLNDVDLLTIPHINQAAIEALTQQITPSQWQDLSNRATLKSPEAAQGVISNVKGRLGEMLFRRTEFAEGLVNEARSRLGASSSQQNVQVVRLRAATIQNRGESTPVFSGMGDLGDYAIVAIDHQGRVQLLTLVEIKTGGRYYAGRELAETEINLGQFTRDLERMAQNPVEITPENTSEQIIRTTRFSNAQRVRFIAIVSPETDIGSLRQQLPGVEIIGSTVSNEILQEVAVRLVQLRNPGIQFDVSSP